MMQATLQDAFFLGSVGAASGAVSASLLNLAPTLAGKFSPVTGAVFGGIQGCLWVISTPFLPRNGIAREIVEVGRTLTVYALSVVLTSALGFPINFTAGLHLTIAMLLILLVTTALFALHSPRASRAF
jgi:hypothetical protein